jgi:hypothetical protein
MTCQECEFAVGCEEMGGAVEEHLRGCGSCRGLMEELQANGDALESMSFEEMPRVRVRRPVLPAVVVLAAAAAVVMLIVAIPKEEKLPPVHYALAPMKFEIPAMRREATRTLRKERYPPLPDGRGSLGAATQPLMVKMLTDDPNVVIYWQIDADQEGNDR